MGENKSIKKLANVFAWINYLLSAICIIVFIVILAFAFFKVEAGWQDKIYAILIILVVLLFPAIFFLLNGVILRSKNNCTNDENEEIGDF